MTQQHLAIFVPPFLDLILEGRKTVEGRFSKVRCAPYGVVRQGDLVLMKAAGGLVRGSFVVARVETFQDLTREDLHDLEERYSDQLQASADPLFWEARKDKLYATLLHVTEPRAFARPFPFPKKDRRGWVVLTEHIPAPQLN